MKKLLCALFCVITLTLLLSCHAFAGHFETDVGDADASGSINTKDVLTIRKYLVAALDEKAYIDLDAADVDGNGSINMVDVNRIRNHLSGMVDITEEYGHVNSGYPVGRLMICGREISDYKILIPEGSGDNITLFSSKLSDYLYNITGVSIPVVTEDDGSPMIVIMPDTENEYGLGDEGYIIKTEEERVTIIGGKRRGCMYGILDFLREYMEVEFRNSGVVYPEWTRMIVEVGIYDTWTPAFEYRATRVSGYTGTSLENFLIPNKTNSLETNTNLHSSRYGNGLGRTYSNAHSFNVLIESCDDMHQPCLSDEKIYLECVDNLLALIEQRNSWGYIIGEDMNQFSCSLNDNTDYCVCAKCKAMTVEEGSLAGPLIRFVNRVSEVVYDEYPELDVFTIAYYEFRVPPKTVVPAHNLIICYCWNGCNNHFFGSGECRDESHYDINYNNILEEQYFLGWAEITDKLYSWYYVTNFIYYMAPTPNIYNIYNDIAWLYDNGATGVFVEGSGNITFEALKGYLCAKMEENPLMTEEEFMDLMCRFLENTYGPGWEYILKYIDLQTAAGDAAGCFVDNYEMPFDMYDRTYMAEHYGEMKELFEAAYDMAETGAQRTAIRKASVHMYFLGLSATYERDYVNGDSATRKAWENDYKNKLYKYAKELNISLGKTGSIPPTDNITGSPMLMWYDLDTGSRGER